MLRKMFGQDNVACLSAYGTFQIKGLLKDVGRIYDIDHTEINKINKKIESELRALYVNQDKSTIVIKLNDIERVSSTFNNFVEKYPKIGNHLKTLYGRNRHIGRHASGVVIGDNLPRETSIFTSKGVVQTSFTEGIVNKNISAMGMIKFDILSIATLKVINHTLKLISKETGRNFNELKESIREKNIDMDDITVLRNIFHNGNMCGIFQFSNTGIRKLATKIKPDCFDDVSAICSLYRPGPLGSGMDKLYYQNKNDKNNIQYDHEVLRDILSSTYGCLVYQEQLMKVANKLGKLSWKDVQRIRKVLLKKDKSKGEEFLRKENEELKEKFINGCKENGLTEELAEKWWQNLLYFGGYGFAKNHSDAYTVMTIQCAYLATYYPLEFYAAVLTCAQAGEIQDYISDIKRTGVDILPVDINESKESHIVVRYDDETKNKTGKIGAIRLSFSSILGVGPSAIEKIVQNQPYKDFIDFIDRSGASKTSILPLILVGAFTNIVNDNIKLLEKKYELYLSNSKYKTKKLREEFLQKYNDIKDIKDYELHEKVYFENELMGFSVRGSPFDILDREIKINRLFDDVIVDYNEFIESELEVAMLPVLVKDVRERAQRNGQMMAFLKVTTNTGNDFDCPCFSTIWKHISSKVKPGFVYVMTFNRKLDDPQNFVLGKPGFAHSQHSALSYAINVDEITL